MSFEKKLLVPDTLTLEDRAAYSLNAMIGVADEEHDYIPFFSGFFQSDPAWMSHGNWDYGSSHGRLTDAVILARRMTGSSYGEEVEEHYHQNLLSFFKEDGLNYRRNNFSEKTIIEHMSRFEDSASMIDQRAVLLGLTTWFMETGDERAKEAADRHVAALKRIARKERDSWFYPASEFTEHGWPYFDAVHTRLCPDPAAMWGRQVFPIIRYYQLTGSRDALELAENFAANIVNRSGVFGEDGSFNPALGYRNGHFHTRMGTLASLARFADVTDDSFLIAYVKKCFDWARTQCTSFGWTPGDLADQAYEHETCTLVDAIGTAIILASKGYTEYWGVAERFIRGHLTEAQLLDTSWIQQYDKKDKDTTNRTYYKVADRLKGAFAGYAAPNDFVYSGQWGRGHIMDVQTCCLAGGTRGLYNAWSHIVTEKNGRVSVNMLFNRSTNKLNVFSYLPHEGKVVIEALCDIPELQVRTPEWIPYGAANVEIRPAEGEAKQFNGRQLPWLKKYFIKLTGIRRGDTVTLTFPMMKRVTTEKAVNLEYRTQWLGDDVVGIDPQGTYYPLYSNKKVYEKAPMVEKILHVEDKPSLD